MVIVFVRSEHYNKDRSEKLESRLQFLGRGGVGKGMLRIMELES